MKLVKFTHAANNEPEIHINPDQVTAVKPLSKTTLIYVAGSSGNAAVCFPVREPIDDVVSRLTS